MYVYLYIKQKVFSLKDKFYVTDENDNQKYYIESEFFKIPKTLHLFNADGREIAVISRIMFKLLPRFKIERDGREEIQIAQKFSFFKPKYVVEGTNWTVEGNFLSHDYMIKDGTKIIASIHKKWMAWGDSFELSIDDKSDIELALAVIITIDYVMDLQQSSSYSAN
ncbi:MAG: LURP-one-related family protein [Clostridia bacterium]|nr:LURP-one-related family protein [Clostridia bacterium]